MILFEAYTLHLNSFDAALTSLVVSLSNNKSDSWTAPSSLLTTLCNTPSVIVMDMVNSNHTLDHLGDESTIMPKEIESLM